MDLGYAGLVSYFGPLDGRLGNLVQDLVVRTRAKEVL